MTVKTKTTPTNGTTKAKRTAFMYLRVSTPSQEVEELEGMRLPRLWKGPLAEGRLLVLSPFAQKERRITADQAQLRNHFVAALADQILVAHAGAGSKTEAFVRDLRAGGKPVWTLASSENEHLLSHGVRTLEPDRALEMVNAPGLASG